MSGKYKEIFRLKGMLEGEGIPFKWRERPEFHGHQICFPTTGDGCVCSVIEHDGSYGCEEDLLEIQGLMSEEEERKVGDTVLGSLTAENVFARIKAFRKRGVKPFEPDDLVSNRMLAMWLGKGNGEYGFRHSEGNYSIMGVNYPYDPPKGDWMVNESIVVRKWEDSEWVVPTRRYCFPETVSPTPDEIGG